MQTSLRLLRRVEPSAFPYCRCCAFSTSALQRRQVVAYDDFTDAENELRRRKRKAEAKRRQHGSSFLDHLVVSVRGGTGGSGAAAFVPMKSSSIGPPSGGNGGQGGSVYFTTSPHLSSLVSVGKRLRGGKGLNGLGSYQHGRRGGDLIVELPVGTVVKELGRVEGDAADGSEGEADRGADGLDHEERDRIRREKIFIKHPTADITEDDYRTAERHLAKEGRLHASSLLPGPIEIDISSPVAKPILISPGGQGGLGNPHFYTEQGRPPRLASRGLTPPTITLSLELKLLADVGLVGFPNAGKSTILRALTGRKAEVAGYQFTTLNPQVGVVRVKDDEGGWKGGMREGEVVEETWVERENEREAREKMDYWAPPEHEDRGKKPTATPATDTTGPSPSKQSIKHSELIRFTISDNPGLLPLASENYGLGHSFLRSIERSLALVYVLDLTREHPEEDMRALQHELEAYKPGLSEKVRLVVLNKEDGVNEELLGERSERVRAAVREMGGSVEVVKASARHTRGLKEVVKVLGRCVKEARDAEAATREIADEKDALLVPAVGTGLVQGVSEADEEDAEETRMEVLI